MKSFGYAFKGIFFLVSREHNAWIHLAITILVIGSAFYFDVTRGEWIILILCIGLVWMAEAFNTALEKMVDLVSPERKQLAGEIKAFHTMSLADCFAAALAKQRKAEIYTGDPEFRSIEKEVKIIWI